MFSQRKHPYPLHGRSMEILGGEGAKAKSFKHKYGLKLKFKKGLGVAKQKNKHPWGGIDIFWHQTIKSKAILRNKGGSF